MPSHDTGHLGLVLNVLAVVEDGPELTVEGALVLVVQVAEHGLDGLGGVLGVVEGDTAVMEFVSNFSQITECFVG